MSQKDNKGGEREEGSAKRDKPMMIVIINFLNY